MTAARNLTDADVEALAAQLEALGFVRRRPRAKRARDVVVSDLDRQRADFAARRLGIHIRKDKR